MPLDVISGAAGGLVRSSFVFENTEGHTGSIARVQPIVRDKARRLPHGLHDADPDVVIDALAHLGIEPVVPHNSIHSPAPEQPNVSQPLSCYGRPTSRVLPHPQSSV